MTDLDRAADPRTDRFPYSLEVNDTHDPDDGIYHYPREGYARLSYLSQETRYTHVADYIQEQDFPTDRPIRRDDIHAFMFPYEIGSPETVRRGWETGPAPLWDFIETVRDEYYEHGIDPSKLPIRVLTHRDPISDPGADDYGEYCEVYFRNGSNDVEYLMWNSNELYGPADNSAGYVVDSELVQTVLVAFARAYEEPHAFLDRWRSHAVQL